MGIHSKSSSEITNFESQPWMNTANCVTSLTSLSLSTAMQKVPRSLEILHN
jgi:hypothetical protein